MTTFSSGLSASISSYLALKRALGRQYTAEERVLAHLDRFLTARRVDLVAETFAAWCLTLQHLASGTRRARMRIVRNLCLYRGRSEPGCFVPDERLFPPDHQAIRPHSWNGLRRSEGRSVNVESGDPRVLTVSAALRRDCTLLIAHHWCTATTEVAASRRCRPSRSLDRLPISGSVRCPRT